MTICKERKSEGKKIKMETQSKPIKDKNTEVQLLNKKKTLQVVLRVNHIK